MLLPEQPANGHCVLKSRLLIQRQRQICAVKELVKQRNRIIRNGGDYALEHHNFALGKALSQHSTECDLPDLLAPPDV